MEVTGAITARSLSLWHATVDDALTPRPPVPGDIDVDVAIVGAGYTGLWTAYYLRRRDPSIRVAVVEREFAGFGASGRNGGWCSALFAGDRERTANSHGRVAAVALQRAMFDTVDEVGRVALVEGIDCHFAKGGTISVATLPAHLERLRAELAYHESYGFDDDDYRWMDADEARDEIGCEPCLGALYTPHCAAIHPARLARGLAHAVERHGAAIYEQSAAQAVEAKRVRTKHGTVRAEFVVWATEAFTATLRAERRSMVPVYSLMVGTEPLGDEFWSRAGLARRPTFTDGRHLLIYGQRTADGRLAFGGRGAPYHFGSRMKPSYDLNARVFERLTSTLCSLFPGFDPTAVTHRWGGAVAIPRDFYSTVGLDRTTGLGWAGGYVGDGVATTNLAGRTLADLILGLESDLTELPWVGHRSPRWELEPFRWLGINAGRALMASMDRAEAKGRRPRKREAVAKRLLGGH